jgi:hypothetical protein
MDIIHPTKVSLSKNEINKVKSKLVLVMMVKNEDKRILISFDSIKSICNTFVILDTGSTDNTIEVIKKYCDDNKISLHLKHADFVDFEISRNVLLDFCDEVLPINTYLFLFDCNDELRNQDALVKFINSYTGKSSAFYINQQWLGGVTIDSYKNIRLVRSHNKWRYRLPVHEYISRPDDIKDLPELAEENSTAMVDDLVLFQNRNMDDDKSFKRFKRDKVLLYNYLYSKEMKETDKCRVLFYLAQTYGCLEEYEDSYKYYLLRSQEKGFYEEVFYSLYRLGELSTKLKHDWEQSLQWYMKAFQQSQRAEPLIKIAEYYTQNNLFNENKPEWLTAYMYASMACELVYPESQVLFVNVRYYTYERWRMFAHICYNIGKYRQGKEAIIKAIEAENIEYDINLLKMFINKELECLNDGKISNSTLTSVTYANNEIRTPKDTQCSYPREKFLEKITFEIQTEFISFNKHKKSFNLLLNIPISISANDKNMESIIFDNNNSKRSSSVTERLKQKLKDKKDNKDKK